MVALKLTDHEGGENMSDDDDESLLVARDLGYPEWQLSLVRKFIFFLVMLVNLDHGAMPAANVYIKKDFGIDEAQIGVLMALVFLGFIFGAIITPCLSRTF